MITKTNVLLLILLGGVFSLVYAHEIKFQDAVDAIVGEAANQSEDTMICVAQALRHRGTLVGVYGRHANHNAYENGETWEKASEAWETSDLIKDKVDGAKNWGTMDDLLKLHHYGFVARCGDLYFY